MAIVQISRITQRKGLQVDLPDPLAGAEFGWSVDERRLFIGNGTLEEGAPVVGNTEILTEFSDIINISTPYTYKGQAAGYTVQTNPDGAPIQLSLQQWMDQWASVLDFGAVGDGVADDTDAINNALYQIYCVQTNPQIRRALFFPAGVYKVTSSINVPPYATLYGEGANNSVIRQDGSDYTVRTSDSLQQTGINIGDQGATTPQSITITDLGFSTSVVNNIALVEDATNVTFNNVSFTGPLTKAGLATAGAGSAGVHFDSTPTLTTSEIQFNNCNFSGTSYAVNTNNQVSGISINQSKFDTLYQGIVLGTGVSPETITGFRITNCFFDNIYSVGINIGTAELNASAYNIFYDVGNYFAGPASPQTPIIVFGSSNNISVGDMFERTDANALTVPRIDIGTTTSIAFTNSTQLALGRSVMGTGQTITLLNNQGSSVTIFTVDISTIGAFNINYLVSRAGAHRYGTISVATDSSGTALTYSDEYNESAITGIIFSITQTGSIVSVKYTSTNTGSNAELKYTLNYFS